MSTFKAYLVSETEDGKYEGKIIDKSFVELPEGEVLIKVEYSSLNYKDALSCIGNKGVTRKYPHTPGIDAAGVVAESSSDVFKEGDAVLVTGYDLGMNTSGGFAEYIRVPAGWVVPMPDNMSAKEAMTVGTAGFTAAMSVMALQEEGISADRGDILVTGSTGGVGSIATAILADDGYSVYAGTRKESEKDFLVSQGAKDIISYDDVTKGSEKPMMKPRWAGGVDTVGGDVLSALIKSASYGGCVANCGLAGGIELNINVFPFILRGVSLRGIDSVECPMGYRLKVWENIAGSWKSSVLKGGATEISLEEVDDVVSKMLKGQIRGRYIVKI